MQTRGKKACLLFPECSFSYAKIMQGECNSKAGRRSLTRLDAAEPKLILCKDKTNRAQNKINKRNSSIYFSCGDGAVFMPGRHGEDAPQDGASRLYLPSDDGCGGAHENAPSCHTADKRKRSQPHGSPFLLMKKHFYENIDYLSASAAILSRLFTYLSYVSDDMSVSVVRHSARSSFDSRLPLLLHRLSIRLAMVVSMAIPE